jgi:hypothetical protein
MLLKHTINAGSEANIAKLTEFYLTKLFNRLKESKSLI